MKDKVLLFGGTTEGRVLSECLRKENISHTVSVATEYGLELLKEGGEQSVISGRKSASEIAELITDGGFTVVVDSTHPFATLVSKEVRDACRMTDTKYLRLKRDTESSLSSYSGAVYVDSLDGAVKELEKSVGNILLLTGSRDLEKITAGLSDISRVFARVLTDEESINKWAVWVGWMDWPPWVAAVNGILSSHISMVSLGCVSDSCANAMACSTVGELDALVGRGSI